MAELGGKKRRVEDAPEAEQDKAGSARSQPSCTECQRRKQKCSRKWPCNHCSARKVPHLCQFGANRAGHVEEEIPPSKEAIELIEVQPGTEPAFSEIDGFKTWGYMPEHQYYQLGISNGLPGGEDATNEDVVPIEDITRALQAIPSRYISDSLVQNFLYNVNYLYYSIYPPTFLDDYDEWWMARANGQKISAELTCLLLRIFALSSQYPGSNSMRKSLEFELGEPVQNLTWRFHRAAEQLSRCFVPGTGGLYRVQQLFISAYWFKSEAKFVESWHALASSIREAQELGLHKDSPGRNISDFDREMRRRVWALLYMWDWQMSRWLSRPIIINHRSCKLVLPTLNLEKSPTQSPGLPSPFSHIAIQAQLCGDFSTKFSNLPDGPPSVENIMAFQKAIDDWFDSFPAVYNISNPDTTCDEEHPYVIQQRRHLNATGLMAKLDPFKPFLTQTKYMKPPNISSELEAKLRAMGIDIALDMIGACRGLFELTFPSNARYHFTMFATFDTAAVLCSALLQDKEEHSLPRRRDVVVALGSAVQLMRLAAPLTRAGDISFRVLSRLVHALPLTESEKELVSQIAGFEKIESSLWSKAKPNSQLEPIAPSTSSNRVTSSRASRQVADPTLGFETNLADPVKHTSGLEKPELGKKSPQSRSSSTAESWTASLHSSDNIRSISGASESISGYETSMPVTAPFMGASPGLEAGVNYANYSLPNTNTTTVMGDGMTATGWGFALDPNLSSYHSNGNGNALTSAPGIPGGTAVTVTPTTTATTTTQATNSSSNSNSTGVLVGPQDIGNIDFGDLGAIWNWETLNLGQQ